jgi:hypothetical protein
MNLSEKIIAIYPELEDVPFMRFGIIVQDDSDGKGPYIKEWNHPTLTRPTQAQLDSVEE